MGKNPNQKSNASPKPQVVRGGQEGKPCWCGASTRMVQNRRTRRFWRCTAAGKHVSYRKAK